MSEYKPHLKCAGDFLEVSNIGNTVIGILFEKKGSEIKQAITARLDLIVRKITDYNSVSSRIEKFLEEKKKVLKELDLFVQKREDERDALVLPYDRQVEEIAKKRNDSVFDFNKVTKKDLGKKAVVFDAGFEQFKTSFDELDEFLKREENVVRQSVTGYSGPTGTPGMSGTPGYVLPGVYTQTAVDNSGNSGTSTTVSLYSSDADSVTREEDEATAKLCTLRNILACYGSKLESLKGVVRKLEDEKRRLTLIRDNIGDDRIFKLDLAKLSAFGFEDMA